MAQNVIDVLDREGPPIENGGRLWPIHVQPETGAIFNTHTSHHTPHQSDALHTCIPHTTHYHTTSTPPRGPHHHATQHTPRHATTPHHHYTTTHHTPAPRATRHPTHPPLLIFHVRTCAPHHTPQRVSQKRMSSKCQVAGCLPKCISPHSCCTLSPLLVTAIEACRWLVVCSSGRPTGRTVSWGAMGDSFYEYLLKMWLITGKKHEQCAVSTPLPALPLPHAPSSHLFPSPSPLCIHPVSH